MSDGLDGRPRPTTSYQLAALPATQSRAQSGERTAMRPQSDPTISPWVALSSQEEPGYGRGTREGRRAPALPGN